MKPVVLTVLLLAGCSSHTAWRVSSGTPPPTAPVYFNVTSTGGGAALFGLTILGAGVYEATRDDFDYGAGSARPPEMAPDRKVSEQDCTKPLDYSLGNIRCK